MKGRRVHPNGSGRLTLAGGDYGKDIDGLWWVRPPGGRAGTLEGHIVTEHEDETITVSPSIWDDHPGGFHGYLERGIWRSVTDEPGKNDGLGVRYG